MRLVEVKALIVTTFLTASCENARPPGPEEPNPLVAPPVDSSRVRSAEETASWPLKREASTDLDGDGSEERITLACDVSMGRNGVLLWEDGHRWALVIESEGGRRTLAYAAFVPRGFVEAALLAPDDQGKRRVLIQERTPEQQRALEVEYHGPGDARSHSAAYYTIERWLPGSATLP